VHAAFLFDFDGTITMKDTSEMVLDKFAKGDWKIFDQQMDRGEISLEKCMKEQFKLVEARPDDVLEYLDGRVHIRNGFAELVMFLLSSGSKVAVVSAGLDFVIAHYLRSLGLLGEVEVITGKTDYNGHIEFEFPPVRYHAALDFKQDMVIHLRRTFDRIEYFGDGSSDYNAARSADHCYTVRGSRLDRLCHAEGIDHTEFNDFQMVMNLIKNIN